MPLEQHTPRGKEPRHDTVLLKEAVEALAIQPAETVVDATLGGAGHFAAILERLGEGGTVVGIDADAAAVNRARETYARDRRPERPVAHLVNDNFRNIARVLERLGVGQVDAALFDLGWSGFQLADVRGFSFQNDEPLIMTYGESDTTAADLVNTLGEEALADLIYTYGEERFARGIAKAIVATRSHERILTTHALVEAVKEGTPRFYHTKINPATKTFQALRIAVNDELGSIRDGLSATLDLLAPGGRLAVITFHSIEDRIVKNLFRDATASGRGELATKKPVVPSKAEIISNRRARSAKLRVFTRAAQAPRVIVPEPLTLLSYV